jgi:hypothetical protein
MRGCPYIARLRTGSQQRSGAIRARRRLVPGRAAPPQWSWLERPDSDESFRRERSYFRHHYAGEQKQQQQQQRSAESLHGR